MKKTAFCASKSLVFVLKNIGIAILIIILILVGVILWLRKYTLHGTEIEVPMITSMFLEEAAPILENAGLTYQVIDSTFSEKVPLGTIVEQTPPKSSKVKPGRTIYLIINAQQRPKVILPELHDIGYRQVQTTLKALGIEVDSISFEPSEYKDLVLDIRYQDLSIPAGTQLEAGSTVQLVVGRGKGTELVPTPDLRGKNLQEVRTLLVSQYLTLGGIYYDEEVSDENKDLFVVFSQTPEAGEEILEGSRVDIQLSTDINKVIHSDNTANEDDFF